jgi:hypothetical protein
VGGVIGGLVVPNFRIDAFGSFLLGSPSIGIGSGTQYTFFVNVVFGTVK